MSTISGQDDMFKVLAQYLGLDEKEYTGETGLLDALAPAPDEEAIKKDLRLEFKDVLGSLQEQTQGYGEGVKEAMTSQQRQELAQAARRTGGSQRMLSGRAKGAALVQSKYNQATKQAGAIQNVAEAEKTMKDTAKDDLSKLETSLAKSAQSQADVARETRQKTGMSLFQLAQLARTKTV